MSPPPACGCTVVLSWDDHQDTLGKKATIIYCPTHAVAEEMVKALTQFVNAWKLLPNGEPTSTCLGKNRVAYDAAWALLTKIGEQA